MRLMSRRRYSMKAANTSEMSPMVTGGGRPGMQGGEPHFGAVAEQEENEGEIEQGRIEFGGAHNQAGPDHGIGAFAHDRPGGHVDQNGTEQGERDSPAAADEI